MTISDLYSFPLLTSQPSDCPPYNPSLPVQAFRRELGVGENASDDFVYQYVLQADGKFHTNVISKGQAASPNYGTVPVGVAFNSSVTPVPADPTKLLTGYSIIITPFGLSIIGTPPSTSPTDPIEARILTGINEILASLGKPSV